VQILNDPGQSGKLPAILTIRACPYMLSRVGVTIDGVWIREWIY
jgi:hypothetical protein